MADGSVGKGLRKGGEHVVRSDRMVLERRQRHAVVLLGTGDRLGDEQHTGVCLGREADRVLGIHPVLAVVVGADMVGDAWGE